MGQPKGDGDAGDAGAHRAAQIRVRRAPPPEERRGRQASSRDHRRPPQDRYEPFPLTDIQQAYWIGRSAAFDLGDVSIHAYSEIEATGMDLGRLSRAFQRLVERHEMLRAIVLPTDGSRSWSACPRIRSRRTISRALAEAAEAELAATRERLAHQLLPADAWPTFEIRASLLDGDRTRVHISLDLLHIDGGSLLKLGHEWALLYRDPGAFLPPLELSFRDYVLAEMELKGAPQPTRRPWSTGASGGAMLPPPPELPARDEPGCPVRDALHPPYRHARPRGVGAAEDAGAEGPGSRCRL